MEQYDKKGPPPLVTQDAAKDEMKSRIRDLQNSLEAQNLEIDQLRREVRRLGARLDQAVNAINGVRRG